MSGVVVLCIVIAVGLGCLFQLAANSRERALENRLKAIEKRLKQLGH